MAPAPPRQDRRLGRAAGALRARLPPLPDRAAALGAVPTGLGLAGLAGLVVLSGCATTTDGGAGTSSSSSSSSTSASGTASRPGALTGDVTVLAAASLDPVMTDLAKTLERDNPGLRVTVSFGASSALAQQVVAGAPADVIVTASAATMRTVTDAGDTDGPPVVVARNSLEIAVPPDDPAGVGSLADLARPGVKVALCAPEVPCGAAAQQLLDLAGVSLTPVTYGRDVSATVALVRLGEVDAALVYRTDVITAAGAVKGVEVPQAGQVVTDYPAAVVEGSQHAPAARAVVDLLASPRGQDALGEAGFAAP